MSTNEKLKNAIHEEFVNQLEGAIQIDLGNYVYEACGKQLYFDRTNYGGYFGLDVYVADSDVSMTIGYPDECMLIHLHPEDMLWQIIHYKESIELAKKEFVKYLEWKSK